MLLVFQVWVFHYESYHVISRCPYHIFFVNKPVELLYHYNTVDGGYVPQFLVDNTSNCVVYNFSDRDMLFFLEMVSICN